jgi:aspartyl-tRNA(Asn)/glutamyl-tRNA(Gln) amidotransferase subunit B
MSDETIEAAKEVIEENKSGWVEDYEDGEDGALNFAVGQVMEKVGGSAHPMEVKQRLLEEL